MGGASGVGPAGSVVVPGKAIMNEPAQPGTEPMTNPKGMVVKPNCLKISPQLGICGDQRFIKRMRNNIGKAVGGLKKFQGKPSKGPMKYIDGDKASCDVINQENAFNGPQKQRARAACVRVINRS